MDNIGQRIRLQLHDLYAIKDKIQCIIHNAPPQFTTWKTAVNRLQQLANIELKIFFYHTTLMTYELRYSKNK
jgi:ribulose-5-phosphate 4-epimerase/fuculose-1-phosphate aldolase